MHLKANLQELRRGYREAKNIALGFAAVSLICTALWCIAISGITYAVSVAAGNETPNMLAIIAVWGVISAALWTLFLCLFKLKITTNSRW